MKFIYSLAVFLSFPILLMAQCPKIEGAMINACAIAPSTAEGINEFVLFNTTAAATAGAYSLNYGNSTPPLSSPLNTLSGSNAVPKNGTGSIVSTNGCIIHFITSPATNIPTGSKVILVPSNFDAAYDVTTICAGGSLYVIYVDITAAPSNTWNPSGTFGNSPSTLRYLQVSNGASNCASNIVSYKNNWAGNTDGNSVWWDAAGNPDYQNNGCSVVTPPKPTITPILIAPVCEGSSSTTMTFTTTGNPDKYILDWNAAANTAGFIDIINAGLPISPLTLNIPAGATAGTYTGNLIAINSSTPDSSIAQNISVIINALPVITVQPAIAPQNICQNGPVSALNITATAGSGTISSYQWYISTVPSNTGGTALPFTNSATYTPSSSNIGTLYFYCKVTNSNGCSTKTNISGAIIVSANPGTPVATATVQPTCLVPTGTIVVTSPTGANIQYGIGGVYQVSGTFYSLAPATYSITAKNTITGCISPIKTVTVNPIPAAPIAPTATATIQPTCFVPSGTIVVTAPIGGNFVYSSGGVYQVGTTFSGLAVNSIFNITVKDILTGCISANTPVTINPLPAAPATPVATVTVQPTCLLPTGTIVISSPSGANIEYSDGGIYQASNIFSGLTNGTLYSLTAKDITTGCISAALPLSVNTIPGAPDAPTASITSQPNCTITTGTITITAPSGLNYLFSDGGSYQASNIFNGLTPGNSYPITVKDISTGCISAPVNLTVAAIPITPAPIINSPLTYCQNATAVSLTATGTGLLWYTVPTGGTGLAIAPTPSTTAAGLVNYYVSQTILGCEGPRDTIKVTVNAAPALPIVNNPVTYCQNATAIPLLATGNNLLWYTTATGGTGLATAPTPSTTVAGLVKYYVSQTILGCEGPRDTIKVTVNATPALPIVNSPVTYCQNAIAVSLSATGTGLLWYTAATGGTGLSSAPTPSTTAAGLVKYYVSQTILGCEGPRDTIKVTVNATPAFPIVNSPVTYCQNATAPALTATGTGLLWYTVPTGGTGLATAPTPSTTAAGLVKYYVSQTILGCEGPRDTIKVTVNATPAFPIVNNPVTYCQNATATALSATGTGLLWYTVATGGTGLATAPTPSTIVAGLVKYYVSQTILGCEGPRDTIKVTVNAIPALPIVNSAVTYCQNATAIPLLATGTGLLWYTTATGGTGLATAPTPSTNAAGLVKYYVSQTILGCEGPRDTIKVTVNATPALPIVNSPVTYCQNATAPALSATGSGLLWYTVATGGTGLATGPIPSTTAAGLVKYYVSQTILGCEGPRDTIKVTVNATPAFPIVNSPVTYCQNATAIPLSASGSGLLWYTSATGGTGLATAPSPSTTAAGLVKYYVSQTILGCEGPRDTIKVTVNATPALPFVFTPVFYCQNNTPVALNATGTNLLWYSNLSGGTGSSITPTPATTIIGNTFYYVSQTNSFGCESPRAAITVTVNPTVNAVTTFSYNPGVVCKNGINPGPVYGIGFTTGGLFTSSAGLAVNSVTGNIDLSSSTAGTYTVKYTYNTQGCTLAGSSTATITINPSIATNTIFSYSSPICKNDPNPSPALANGFTMGGQYSSTTGLSIDALTGLVNLASSNPGIYQVTYTLPTLGCRQSTSNFSFIGITANTLPVTTFSYSPAAVCPGDANPALSKATGFTSGGSFKATPAGLTINAATGSIDVASSTIGVYTITYLVPALGCRFADSSRFTFIIRSATPPNTNFFYSSPVCKSDPVAIPLFGTNFSAGGVFSAPVGLSINSNNGNVNVPQSIAGIYQIKYVLKASACSLADSNTASLEIISLPNTPIITSLPICGSGTTTLIASSNGTILWYSNAATTNLINTGSSFTTNVSANTRYYLTATIGNCTSLISPADIVINPKPSVPYLGNDTSICSGDVLVLKAGNYFSYLWQNGSTLPTFAVNTSGTYSVQVTNAIGCKNTDSITVNILTNCDDIQFANAFSPNGDGYNEFFGPLGNLFLVNNYSFSIFNRYGELVFKSDNPYQKWNGTVKGKTYGNTSFVWVATYVYRGKMKKTQKGNVSLLR